MAQGNAYKVRKDEPTGFWNVIAPDGHMTASLPTRSAARKLAEERNTEETFGLLAEGGDELEETLTEPVESATDGLSGPEGTPSAPDESESLSELPTVPFTDNRLENFRDLAEHGDTESAREYWAEKLSSLVA